MKKFESLERLNRSTQLNGELENDELKVDPKSNTLNAEPWKGRT